MAVPSPAPPGGRLPDSIGKPASPGSASDLMFATRVPLGCQQGRPDAESRGVMRVGDWAGWICKAWTGLDDRAWFLSVLGRVIPTAQ
jgi:hypothetical protein